MKEPLQIAITGPECSGKTTLAKQLSEHFNVPFVPEAARNYLLGLDSEYSKKDVDNIAILQNKLAEQVSEENPDSPYIFHDTEMLTLRIWQEERWGAASEVVNRLWQQQKMDMYLLCVPDLPWEQDGLRENPSDRDRLFEIYKSYLNPLQVPVVEIHGQGDSRFRRVHQALRQISA